MLSYLKKYKKHIFYFGSFAILFFLFKDNAFANNVPADAFGLDYGDSTGLGSQDIRVTIAKIIRAAFGFLGVIALGLVIYGGYTYMTAGGDEGKVETAKKILINATIGLAIILSAFSITQFIISRLAGATGFNATQAELNSRCADPLFANENPDLCDDFGGFGGGDDACILKHFVVQSLTPKTNATNINDVTIRALFSMDVQNNNPAEVLNILQNGVNVNAQFSYEYKAGKRLVEAKYIGVNECNGKKCAPSGNYSIEVRPDVVGPNGEDLEEEPEDCGSLKFPKRTEFVVNTENILDEADPRITSLRIFNSQNPAGAEEPDQWLPRGRKYPILAKFIDNAGIGYVRVEVYKDGDNASVITLYDGPSGDVGSDATPAKPYEFRYDWRIPRDAEQLTRYIVRVVGYDIDGKSVKKDTSFVVIGESCDPNGIEEKEGCPEDGGACEANWQCPSRRCVEGQCLVGSPTILDVNPWSSGAGSWITISGRKFGSNVGTIQFALEGTENWQNAGVVQCPGAESWTDTHVVVSVPDDVALPLNSKSAIRIIKANGNGDSNFIDSTVDNFGPKPGPLAGLFTKNQDIYPGICGVNPKEIIAGGNITVAGKDFGNVQGNSTLLFGNVPGVIENNGNWSSQTILAKVNQNMQAGIVSVFVTVDGKKSNGVPLQIVRADDLKKPEILSVEPQTITPGSLITITGKNFGGTRGIVYLSNTADVNCREENCFQLEFLDEPVECSQSAWSSSQIIVQVPENANPGQYVVIVENAKNSSLYSQNDVKLSVENGDPKPGICALAPDNGPAPLPAGHKGLDIIGINFGEEPKVYFWAKNSVISNNIADYERTWLSRVIPDAGILEDGTLLRTIIPAKDGASMPSGKGPIIVRNGNQLSNPVYYTVSDCTKLDDVPAGYKCCTTSAGAGVLQLEQLMCPGEVREAGYIWRFASGKIPSPPRVLESCDLSSPAPSIHIASSDAACLNALITVAFSKNMDETDFVDNNGNIKNIHVFDCGKGREMSCDYALDIASQFNLRSQKEGNAGHFIILEPKAGRLNTENWYRVVLENKLRSKESIQVLGEEQIQQEYLVTTRPLRDIPTSAYYFDFKTGAIDGGVNGDGMCILKSARIRPSEYFTQLLGVIHYPVNSEDPLYYYVAGKADQNCIEIDVDEENWQWTVKDDHIDDAPGAQIAKVEKSVDDDYQNTRATVEAFGDSQARDVYILANLDKDPQDITATSSLVISLAKPRVRYYEPNCNASCVNASIYVEFNLPMATTEYWTDNNVLYQCNNNNCYSEGVRIFKCLDANCSQSEVVDPSLYNFSDISEKSFSVALKNNFAPNTYYKVEINGNSTGEKIRSLNKINPPIGGKFLESFSWSFRTKNDATACEINDVGVSPELFTARSIGEQAVMRVIAYSSPNECSSRGQIMDPLKYGWIWKSERPEIASVSNFNTFARNSFCSDTCLPTGSDVLRTADSLNTVLCGNGKVDVGEDCDVSIAGEKVGVTCSLSCLRVGNSSKGVAAGRCGNNIVENPSVGVLLGEQCDPGVDEKGVTRKDNPFCTDACLFTGSRIIADESNRKAVAKDGEGNDIFESVCGNENVDLGESCDGEEGCSNKCLHVGTRLSSVWCEKNASNDIRESEDCLTATSVCGNTVIENGEECEVGINGATVETCNSRCLFQNVCNTQLQQCLAGTPGCGDDCTFAGASLLYGEPSLCGDGVSGIGEVPACELDTNKLVDETPGSNPVQIVTAVGLSEGQSTTQTTTIHASKANVVNSNIIESNKKGIAQFALECGYKEFSDKKPITKEGQFLEDAFEMSQSAQNLLLNSSFETEAVINNIRSAPWSYSGSLGDENIGSFLQYISGSSYEGTKHLLVNTVYDGKFWGITQILGAKRKDSEFLVRFAYKLNGEMQVRYGDNRIQNEIASLTQKITDNTIEGDWKIFEQRIKLPVDTDNLRLIIVTNDKMKLDAVSVTAVSERDAYNNCPLNTDNSVGVGYNSCCYPRTSRISSLPSDGAGVMDNNLVCRNTLLEVVLDGKLLEDTLKNNIILARGYEQENYDCASSGEFNVTSLVKETLKLALVDNGNVPGFFGKIWIAIKTFLKNMFVLDTYASSVQNNQIKTWCAGAIAVDTEMAYKPKEGGEGENTHILIRPKGVLAPNMVYSLVLRGGIDGIRDIRGVGIANKDGNGAKDDSIMFKTGADICLLDTLVIEPENYVFTRPEEEREFVAKAYSKTKQQIAPVPGYAWEWNWGPTMSEIFTIPAPNSVTNTESIVIASKNIEGDGFAVVNAIITDASATGLDLVGQAYSAFADLESRFCANPWPSKEVYPYEDNYYNFQMSYCADSGLANTNEDDLPLLREPLGSGIYGDINADGIVDYADAFCYSRGGLNCSKATLDYTDLNCDGRISGGDTGAVTSMLDGRGMGETIDSNNDFVPDCKVYAKEGKLGRWIFFNDKNEDVIGLQIFSNPERYGITQWYESLGYENIGDFNKINIGGYEAITNGTNYYINVLNLFGEKDAKNIIYHFSVNERPNATTRQVLEKLLSSLKFNTNITDFGYCASLDIPVGESPLRYPSVNPLIQCDTDFDCMNEFGFPVNENLSGICANEKTKFLRDWERLNRIQRVQDSLSINQILPDLRAGTFIPGYTNSIWPSWVETLSKKVNEASLSKDPINVWTKCGICKNSNVACYTNDECVTGEGDSCIILDTQTCWSGEKSVFVCPNQAQTFEYKYDSQKKSYVLHAQLEFFSKEDSIVDEFVDLEKFSTGRTCEPKQVQNPFSQVCGDGIVNTTIGEECEPIGYVGQSEVGQFVDKTGTCSVLQNKQCVDGVDCGKITQQNYSFGTFTNKKFVTDKSGYCIYKSGNINYVIGVGKLITPTNYQMVIGCNDAIDCKDAVKIKSYGNWFSWINISSRNAVPTQNVVASTIIGNALPGTVATCQKGNLNTQTCNISEETSILQCSTKNLGPALHTCGADCKWEDPGMCTQLSNCGNGIVERGETCDDGQKNGQYGKCSDTCNGPSQEAGYCGNQKKDGDKEFCDAGACKTWRIGAGGNTCDEYWSNYSVNKELSCSSDCQTYGGYCGDNILQSGNETCDDGNREIGDGCDSKCQLENVACKEDILSVANTWRINGNKDTQIYIGRSNTAPLSCWESTPDSICNAFGLQCLFATFQPFENDQNQVRERIDVMCTTKISENIWFRNGSVTVICDGEYKGQQLQVSAGNEECGNGIVEGVVGEVCDLGLNNGTACSPEYGQSCYYCSATCDQILTVDPNTYCGNGIIDYIGPKDGDVNDANNWEACEFTNNNEILKRSSKNQTDPMYNGELAVCQDKGAYSCTNNCRVLVDGCVNCKSANDGTLPIPKIAVLNVLTPTELNIDWRKQTQKSLFRKNIPVDINRENATTKVLWGYPSFSGESEWENVTGGVANDANGRPNRNYVTENSNPANRVNIAFDYTDYTEQQWLFTDSYGYPLISEVGYYNLRVAGQPYVSYDGKTTRGIESNILCKDEYYLKFKNGNDGNAIISGSEFPYPVAGQNRTIENELVVSPAVPQNSIRAVVRWTDQESQNGANNFVGNFYVNPVGKPNLGYRAEYLETNKSQNMVLSGTTWYEQTSPANRNNNFYAFSKFGSLRNNYVQATSIYAYNKSLDLLNNNEVLYAFYVESITRNGSQPIQSFAGTSVKVDVYTYHQGQNNQYSIYLPEHTFEIVRADRSVNALAKYWHAFNLRVRSNENGNIESITVEPVTDENNVVHQNGIIESCWTNVLCNITKLGQHCDAGNLPENCQ